MDDETARGCARSRSWRILLRSQNSVKINPSECREARPLRGAEHPVQGCWLSSYRTVGIHRRWKPHFNLRTLDKLTELG